MDQTGSGVPEKKERLWSLNFIKICVVSLIIGLALNMTNSTISLYINAEYGSNAMSGVLSVGFAVASMLFRLLGGRISDKFGRTFLQIVGMGMSVSAVLGIGLVRSLPLLVAFRILQGAGHSLSNTAVTAAGVDITPQSRLNEGSSFVTMGFFLSSAVAATLSLALIGDNDRFSNVFFFVAAILGLGILLTATVRLKKDPQYQKNMELAKRDAEKMPRPKGIRGMIEVRAIPAAVLYTIISTAYSILTAFLLVHAKEAGIEGAGWYFTISAILTFAARTFTGPVADKYGPKGLLLASLACGIASFLMLAFSTNRVLFFVSGALYGLLNGISGPVCYAHAIKCSPKDRRGTATGTYYLSSDIAHGLGTMMWALIIDAIGFTGAFLVSAGILVIAVIVSFPVFRYNPKLD